MSSRQLHRRFNFGFPKARENFLSLYIFKKEKKKKFPLLPDVGDWLQLVVLHQVGSVQILHLEHHNCWPGCMTTLHQLGSLLVPPAQLSLFYSSRDVLSSVQQNTRVELLPAALLNCCKGSGAGPRAEARDHNTQAPGSFLDDSAAGPHHHHCVCSTHRHFAHTLLQAQTVHCSAKHQIMWTGSMIWSSTFWTMEKCLQRNCI